MPARSPHQPQRTKNRMGEKSSLQTATLLQPVRAQHTHYEDQKTEMRLRMQINLCGFQSAVKNKLVNHASQNEKRYAWNHDVKMSQVRMRNYNRQRHPQAQMQQPLGQRDPAMVFVM